MASRIPSTRENPKGPPVTPISYPEEILRRDRVSLRQTSKAAMGATLGISRGISIVISNRPPFQSSYAEASNSHKFICKSENFRVEESSSTTACEDLIPGNSIEELWLCEGLILEKIKRGHQQHLNLTLLLG